MQQMNEVMPALVDSPLAMESFQLLRIDFDYRAECLFPWRMGLFELILLVVGRSRKLAKLLTREASVSFLTFGTLIGA